ncbi:MAG: hypothetical protein C5B58_05485 [Acidobacteria bacterium]|nr:MAG: hypothetical protein C5B58_05485 [Acidobacteriota bacterium]
MTPGVHDGFQTPADFGSALVMLPAGCSWPSNPARLGRDLLPRQRLRRRLQLLLLRGRERGEEVEAGQLLELLQV